MSALAAQHEPANTRISFQGSCRPKYYFRIADNALGAPHLNPLQILQHVRKVHLHLSCKKAAFIRSTIRPLSRAVHDTLWRALAPNNLLISH
jgi:hypothetical protein